MIYQAQYQSKQHELQEIHFPALIHIQVWQVICRRTHGVEKNIIFLQFHQFPHFVFEGTKTGGLSAEYVCYGLLFLCLTKSVMNTRTRANGLTCLLTITYPAIILRLLSYSIIQRGVQQKCNMGTEKLKNSFSITIAIP